MKREKENWSTKAVNQEGRYNTKEVWRDRDGKELHPHANYNVGGNTKFYGSALFRLRKEDFVGQEVIIKGFLAKDGTPTVNASSFTLVEAKKEFVNDEKTP